MCKVMGSQVDEDEGKEAQKKTKKLYIKFVVHTIEKKTG